MHQLTNPSKQTHRNLQSYAGGDKLNTLAKILPQSNHKHRQYQHCLEDSLYKQMYMKLQILQLSYQQKQEELAEQINREKEAKQISQNSFKKQIMYLQEKLHTNVGLTNDSIQKLLIVQEFRDRINNLQLTNKQLKQENQALRDRVKWADCQDIQQYQIQLNAKNNQLIEQIQEIKQKNAKNMHNKQQQIKIILGFLNSLKAYSEELQQKILVLEDKSKQMQIKIDQKQEQIQQIYKRTEQLYKEKQQQIQSLKQSQKKLLKLTCQLEKQKQVLEEAVGDQSREIEILKGQKQQLQHQINKQQVKIQEMNEQIRKYSKENDQLKYENKVKEEQNNFFREREIQKINGQNRKNLEDKVIESEGIEQKNRQINRLNAQIGILNEENHELQIKITELVKICNQRQQQIINTCHNEEVQHSLKVAGAQLAYQYMEKYTILQQINHNLIQLLLNRQTNDNIEETLRKIQTLAVVTSDTNHYQHNDDDDKYYHYGINVIENDSQGLSEYDQRKADIEADWQMSPKAKRIKMSQIMIEEFHEQKHEVRSKESNKNLCMDRISIESDKQVKEKNVENKGDNEQEKGNSCLQNTVNEEHIQQRQKSEKPQQLAVQFGNNS